MCYQRACLATGMLQGGFTYSQVDCNRYANALYVRCNLQSPWILTPFDYIIIKKTLHVIRNKTLV